MQARAGVVLALIGSLLGSSLVAGSASAAVIARSTFDSDTDGWTAIVIDGSGNVTPSTASFAGGAGNPGGALRHDAPSEGKTSFFLAPASIVTALHSAVGGFVSWDISTINHSDDVFFSSFADVNIRAGTNRIRLSVTPPAPPIFPTFVHHRLEFGTDAGWLFFDGTNTTPATQAQIDSVLAGAESFIIRAEYWSGATPDTTFLDNVVIGAAPEQPVPTLTEWGQILMVGFLVVSGLWVARRRRLTGA